MEALWLFQQKNGPIASAPVWLNTARVRTEKQRDGEITDFIYASRLAWQITSEDCSRYRGEESHQGSSPLITHRAALAVTSPPCLLPSVEYWSSIPKIFHVKNFQIKMQNLTDQTGDYFCRNKSLQLQTLCLRCCVTWFNYLMVLMSADRYIA